MRKILILMVLSIFSVNFSFAHESENHNNDDKKAKIMQIQNKFMDELKSQVDEETAKKLDEMIKNHRAEMKMMMEKAKKNPPSEEQRKKTREEMKKRHFADLKKALEKYPELYERYSKKMEKIMVEIQEMRKNDNQRLGRGSSIGNFSEIRIRRGATIGKLIIKEGGNNQQNDTQKADLKQLAEQLVNLTIKLRQANSFEERKVLIEKIEKVVKLLKQKNYRTGRNPQTGKEIKLPSIKENKYKIILEKKVGKKFDKLPKEKLEKILERVENRLDYFKKKKDRLIIKFGTAKYNKNLQILESLKGLLKDKIELGN